MLAGRNEHGECGPRVGPSVEIGLEEAVAEPRQALRKARLPRQSRSRWTPVRDEFEQQDSERIHVRSRSRRLAPGLLRRHVGTRTAPAAVEGEAVGSPVVHRSKQPEIHQLERPPDAEHDIARLHVAMHDAAAVEKLEAGQNLCRQVDGESNSVRRG